jgi:hypothetical protein
MYKIGAFFYAEKGIDLCGMSEDPISHKWDR